MNLQSIIDNSRMRDNAVAELCKAIDELDEATLHRVIAYAAARIESIEHYGQTPEARQDAKNRNFATVYAADPKDIIKALRDNTAAAAAAKRIARAEKGVRTRRRNAAKAKKSKAKLKSAKPNVNATKGAANARIIETLLLNATQGISANDLIVRAHVAHPTLYKHLKKLGAYSNGAGLWWLDKKTYLARFPIAGSKKSSRPTPKNALKKLNGTPEVTS